MTINLYVQPINAAYITLLINKSSIDIEISITRHNFSDN